MKMNPAAGVGGSGCVWSLVQATPLPHPPKTRRRLSIHDLDLLDSQDATPTPTGNLEVSPTQQDTSPGLQIQNLWTDLGAT